ncbi:hypothetical protein ADL26_00625 [Thermoactinomyces vulgaris]|nr:hypothetical protein ADL26_00625 [Thermoactinomyces vulgaris]
MPLVWRRRSKPVTGESLRQKEARWTPLWREPVISRATNGATPSDGLEQLSGNQDRAIPM